MSRSNKCAEQARIIAGRMLVAVQKLVRFGVRPPFWPDDDCPLRDQCPHCNGKQDKGGGIGIGIDAMPYLKAAIANERALKAASDADAEDLPGDDDAEGDT